MKLFRMAAAALALGIAVVGTTAPADAFLRKKDVKAVTTVTKKITDPITSFFQSLFRK
jgi:hypothetical protein